MYNRSEALRFTLFAVHRPINVRHVESGAIDSGVVVIVMCEEMAPPVYYAIMGEHDPYRPKAKRLENGDFEIDGYEGSYRPLLPWQVLV